jgi:nucleotide-binding universal stress UspA family protein
MNEVQPPTVASTRAAGVPALYRRILVPYDGSAPARRGLDEAIRIARAGGATVCLLHMVELAPLMVGMADGAAWQVLRDGAEAQGRTLLEQAHEVVRAAGVDVESRLEDAPGRVCDVLVAHAAAHHCDLIVMGTHGRRGWRHAVLGSDAERTVRESPVPVLLVRAADER